MLQYHLHKTFLFTSLFSTALFNILKVFDIDSIRNCSWMPSNTFCSKQRMNTKQAISFYSSCVLQKSPPTDILWTLTVGAESQSSVLWGKVSIAQILRNIWLFVPNPSDSLFLIFVDVSILMTSMFIISRIAASSWQVNQGHVLVHLNLR